MDQSPFDKGDTPGSGEHDFHRDPERQNLKNLQIPLNPVEYLWISP